MKVSTVGVAILLHCEKPGDVKALEPWLNELDYTSTARRPLSSAISLAFLMPTPLTFREAPLPKPFPMPVIRIDKGAINKCPNEARSF